MNTIWIGIIFLCLIIFLYIRLSFNKGAQKALQTLLSLLIPIILSGTAIRIGHLLLPSSMNISYYIAGIGTFLFYCILNPIINKEIPDRYRKISYQSKQIGAGIRILHLWLLLSLITFYINIFFPQYLSDFQFLIKYLTLPIRFFWFFPNM